MLTGVASSVLNNSTTQQLKHRTKTTQLKKNKKNIPKTCFLFQITISLPRIEKEETLTQFLLETL